MAVIRSVKKRKTFKSGFTKELTVLVCLAILISGYLLYYGIQRIIFLNSIKYGQTSDCILSGYVPIGIASLILLTAIAMLLRGLGQYIVITPQSLAYQKGKTAFKENWEKLEYKAPKVGKKFLRSFIVGTGKRLVRIDSMFFPKFDTIVEVIRVAKESRKTKMIEDGMDIDKHET